MKRIIVKEEVKLPDSNIILEKGDKIVISENLSDLSADNKIDLTNEIDEFFNEPFLVQNFEFNTINEFSIRAIFTPKVGTNVNEVFAKECLKICRNYPSVEGRVSVRKIILSINEETFLNADNNIHSYERFERELKEYLAGATVQHTQRSVLSVRAGDYSSMRAMDIGRAVKFFDKYRFDGKKMLDWGDLGMIETITVNNKANDSYKYNRNYFNRLDAEKQDRYMARLAKERVEYEVRLSGHDGFFAIPYYAGQYLVKTFPNVPVIVSQ